jgi:hypothetical protein
VLSMKCSLGMFRTGVDNVVISSCQPVSSPEVVLEHASIPMPIKAGPTNSPQMPSSESLLPVRVPAITPFEINSNPGRQHWDIGRDNRISTNWGTPMGGEVDLTLTQSRRTENWVEQCSHRNKYHAILNNFDGIGMRERPTAALLMLLGCVALGADACGSSDSPAGNSGTPGNSQSQSGKLLPPIELNMRSPRSRGRTLHRSRRIVRSTP